MAQRPQFISAIATPLNADDTLHEEGLRRLLLEQFAAGMDGLLVAGTMGAMPLLSEQTYRDLARWAVEFGAGRGELLIGAGDTSYSRTVERIRFLNALPIDGVVVTAPFYAPPTQAELIAYFTALAEESRAPLYLYDHPFSTGIKLTLDMVTTLAEHPNIRGIKCSDDPAYMRRLLDQIGERFRVVIAASMLMDMFLRQGAREFLDGVFCLCPAQVVGLGRAAQAGDWETATRLQQGINQIMQLLLRYGVWPAFQALMNRQGVPGKIRPRPFGTWSAEETETFFADTETQAALAWLRSAPRALPTEVGT